MGSVPFEGVAHTVLFLLRLAVFALSLGLTLISFEAYRRHRSERLESAFVGFAFLSMGAAMGNLGASLGDYTVYFHIAETVPFIVGFSMLYLSLYR